MRALALLGLLACGKSEPRSTTTLVVSITDAGKPVAARVLLFAPDGEPVRIGTLDLYGQRQAQAACEIAPGVIGSWNGLVVAKSGEVPIGADKCNPSPGIAYGRYKVWAWRGIEYELWEGEVDLSADRGRVELAIALQRAWTPTGALAADMHVHAAASNDSTLPNPQRVIAQAAAGIQVIGLSDHDANGDLDAEIAELGFTGDVISIAANELTSEQLHVNVYPVVVDRTKPRGGSPTNLAKLDATALFALARGMPGNPIVQLNHPRFRYQALYDGTSWDGVTWPPPFPTNFDAVEVLAGYSAFNMPGDRRFDESARDYFTFVDHGRLIVALGNSDTHDLNWVLDGTARTYVYADKLDEESFLAALRARKTVATTGPWLDVELGTARPGDALKASGIVKLDVELTQAKFVRAEQIDVWLGNRVVHTARFTGQRHRLMLDVDVGSTDTWLAVTASSDHPMPKEITGTYQQDRWKRPGVTPFALSSPILIDADGNGRWTRGDADIVLP